MTNSSQHAKNISNNMATQNNKPEIRRQQLTRYVTPLREGGSLPALAEADDDFKYVVKFRGAGHGAKALVAEFIGGEVARALGLRVPELVFLDLDEDFGRTEGDEEIQDLLKASQGLNLGLHFLSGALTYDTSVNHADPFEASMIVWLDAFLTNVDRTGGNTNMLVWNHELWLIDHGATLYFHHSWKDWERAMLSPFAYIKDHSLLREASMLDEADAEAHRRLTPELLCAIVDAVPDEWLIHDGSDATPEEIREVYRRFLCGRFENSQIFLKQAKDARQTLI